MTPLPPDEVHVWRTGLSPGDAELAAASSLLSPDERARADRFMMERSCVSFTAARAFLRRVLARYVAADPAALAFRYTEFGKPSLATGGDLRFTLSHSGDLAVLAIARAREVGIDVEAIRPVDPHLPERFFSRREVAAIAAVPEPDRLAAFFRCWTRKEAFLKATGEGFNRSLASFAVTLGRHEPPAVSWVEDDPGEAARWQIAGLDLGPGYAGALASPSRGWRVRPMP